MTNLKTIATTCLAISGLAMAQEGTIPSGSFPTPTSSSSSSVAAPRTGLYTSVTEGNAAADNTVDDYSRRPTLIGDRQYVAGFGGADMANAAFNFSGRGWNWFGSVIATDSLNQIRAGLGSGTAWGAGAVVGVDRIHNKDANGATETTTYYEPSGIAVFGDFNLGGSDVYGQIGWNTGLPSALGMQNSTWNKPAAGAETDNNFHTLSIMGGWKKDATTEGTHALNIEAAYTSEMVDTEAPVADATLNHFTVLPSWGYIFKVSTTYSVFVGVNGNIDFIQPEDGTVYSITAMPNFAFQKQFSKGFEGFAGFAVTGIWGSESDVRANGSERSQLATNHGTVDVGLRWVDDNFALEGSLKEAVLANGPYLIGGNAGQGLFVNVGIALGF